MTVLPELFLITLMVSKCFPANLELNSTTQTTQSAESESSTESTPLTEINLVKELLVENATTIRVDLNEELQHDVPVIVEKDTSSEAAAFSNEDDDEAGGAGSPISTNLALDNSSSTGSIEESSTTETTTTPKFVIEFNTLKDIAYYLRAHKFNEYDRRYETEPITAPRAYYRYFPKPPLRSLHWEVRRYCEPSFEECANYLWKTVKTTGLRRIDDTSIVMQEQNWTLTANDLQIEAVDSECLKLARRDDILAEPFAGPIERFQWRTTASYYMCWYTMKGQKELQHLNESCDNFAYCLDRAYGPNNKDFRADDRVAFACALYSFCPDPCCNMKHLNRPDICYNSRDNPCFENNPAGRRACALERHENTDFTDLVLNRWNVSCNCMEQGFSWNSLYGICVDVDECLEKSHNCAGNSQACVNLRGGFRCACKWGHQWNPSDRTCVLSPALTGVALKKKVVQVEDRNVSYVRQIVRTLYVKLFPQESASRGKTLLRPLFLTVVLNCVLINSF